jgi:MFS family permease
MTYNISWGPVPWLYMSEIFPTRIREGAIAVGTATQWLFNFVFSQITPHAINNLGWRTFLMFAIFNLALVAYTWFFIKETKGRSLEEMELCKWLWFTILALLDTNTHKYSTLRALSSISKPRATRRMLSPMILLPPSITDQSLQRRRRLCGIGFTYFKLLNFITRQ